MTKYKKNISDYKEHLNFLYDNVIFIGMRKTNYNKRIMTRVTEDQLKMIIRETINEQKTQSKFLREAIIDKLNSKK